MYICSVKQLNIYTMTTIKITYKPQSRIGNGMIAENSVMVADISAKAELWAKYGDQDLANIWANQILQHRFGSFENCILIDAKVITNN